MSKNLLRDSSAALRGTRSLPTITVCLRRSVPCVLRSNRSLRFWQLTTYEIDL